MGAIFRQGENKIRPGVFRRYEKTGSNGTPGAIYGVFAIPVHADFGPIGEVKTFGKDEVEDLKAMYTGGTVDAALALFDGGATKVHVFRLGTGGSVATIEIESDGGATIAGLSTKYPTADNYNITIKEKLGDATTKQVSVYRGTTLLEKIDYAASEDEGATLMAAIDASSVYLKSVTSGSYTTGAAAAITNAALEGGKAPTVTTEDYSTAFEAFETLRWNYLVLDTCDTAVHALVQAYINRIYEDGALGSAIIGEPTTVEFETRLAHAKAFNDEKIIYLGSGYEDVDGNKVDGYLAVAVQAGIIGSMESNISATHTVIPGAVKTLEALKNSHYERAIQNGMLLLSASADGQVWFDSGINTLTTPGPEQDEGWKKIRRTATRFEAFDRIDRAVEPVIGQVNCDNIGIGDVIMLGQSVLDAMVQEGKFYAGATFTEDERFKRGADYAHFAIDAVDMDSLEKIYLCYRFKFSAE